MNLLQEFAMRDIIKFGSFILKSGQTSNYYINLKALVSYPDLLNDIVDKMITNIDSNSFDYVCGVPYGAICIATLLSVKLNKPMLLLRKEQKGYGMKNLIEGNYQQGGSVLLVEDVVTTASSVQTACMQLADHGLNVSEIHCVVSRQSDPKICVYKDITVKSLVYKDEITKYNYSQKQEKFAGLIERKGKLCIAADVSTKNQLYTLIEQCGNYISVLKTHIDMMKDFDNSVIDKLIEYKKQYGFAIWEDRKFADIGNVVYQQMHGGIYKISSWADYVSVHVISGPGILDVLENLGAIVIVNMSSKNNIMDESYQNNAMKLIINNSNVVGVVSQIKYDNITIPQIVPGISLSTSNDNRDQTYNSIENKKWANLFVVGRGITKSPVPCDACREYVDAIKLEN